jgi:hypothetical protein
MYYVHDFYVAVGSLEKRLECMHSLAAWCRPYYHSTSRRREYSTCWLSSVTRGKAATFIASSLEQLNPPDPFSHIDKLINACLRIYP